MSVYQRLADAFAPQAASTRIQTLSVGLGYTAVTTADGGIGIAFTALDAKNSCSVLGQLPECEGHTATDLAAMITSAVPLHRSIGLATINALNWHQAVTLPEDRDNSTLFSLLGIQAGTKVAMVGYFGPLVTKLRDLGAELEVVDHGRNLGDARAFEKCLSSWAQALIMTSTSLLNNTTEEILACTSSEVRTALLGPSTPLAAAPFASLPVHVLAGTVPVDREDTLRAIRHGQGTPVLQKYARKPFLSLV